MVLGGEALDLLAAVASAHRDSGGTIVKGDHPPYPTKVGPPLQLLPVRAHWLIVAGLIRTCERVRERVTACGG